MDEFDGSGGSDTSPRRLRAGQFARSKRQQQAHALAAVGTE
jgi:hypothetical protein